MKLEALQAELTAAKARYREVGRIRDAQYWTFTRTARGQPVQAEVAREFYDLEATIGRLRRQIRELGGEPH